MLTSYQNLTSQLLQNPAAPSTLYTTANLTNYINIARGQIAGEAQCIRVIGTISTAFSQINYNFSSISVTTTPGVQGVINARSIWFSSAGIPVFMNPYPWEWFLTYNVNSLQTAPGVPASWAQYGQGSSGGGAITGVGAGAQSSGSFFVYPPPNAIYQLNVDCVCYPTALAADSDPEALPYLWTDAVPYFAAYFALMSAQTSQRIQQAQEMLQLYKFFMDRARRSSTPDVFGYGYAQSGVKMPVPPFGINMPKAGA